MKWETWPWTDCYFLTRVFFQRNDTFVIVAQTPWVVSVQIDKDRVVCQQSRHCIKEPTSHAQAVYCLPSSSRQLHLSTCRTGCSTSLICRRDVQASCDRRPPVSSMSARRGLSLLAIPLLLLLAHDSGTVYLLMFSLPHSQHFARSWKHVYFGNHTQTLFFSFVAIVVLEVTFSRVFNIM